MNRVIVNVATGEYYQRGQARLLASLDAVGEGAARMMWVDYPGPPHEADPYGFKVDAMAVAARHGHEVLLWLDATVVARGPLAGVWNAIERDHVLLWRDGWDCAQWTSDAALAYFGVSRDDAAQIPQTLSGVLGVDLRSEVGAEFWRRWRAARDAMAFRGSWTNNDGEASADPRCLGHRHDQSAASIIGWQLGVPFQPLGVDELLVYEVEGGTALRVLSIPL